MRTVSRKLPTISATAIIMPVASDNAALATDVRRNDAGNSTSTRNPSTAPMHVVYMVTHKHRLRDCHGKLTFTTEGLRFDSDEPEDSFEVAVDEVTLQGELLRIRSKRWRFEFDGIPVERVFNDWKAATVRPASAP